MHMVIDYRSGTYPFDAAVTDKDDRVVALVEVKETPRSNWPEILAPRLKGMSEGVEFILAVDLGAIRVYRIERNVLGDPVAVFGTAGILSHYDADFSKRRVFQPYLLTLVEAWLRDLAYHWRSESPPGQDELRESGFLSRLEGGGTRRLDV